MASAHAMKASRRTLLCSFFIRSCPDEAQCSHQSFKNAKAWGWTKQSCQQQLRAHLKNSGLHLDLFTDEIERMIAATTIESATWEGPISRTAIAASGSVSSPDTSLLTAGARLLSTIGEPRWANRTHPTARPVDQTRAPAFLSTIYEASTTSS